MFNYSWRLRPILKTLRIDDRLELLADLISRANNRRRCWPSMLTLHDDTGSPLEMLTRAKKWLLEVGAIRLVPYTERVGPEKALPKQQHVYELTGVLKVSEQEFYYLDLDNISPHEISPGESEVYIYNNIESQDSLLPDQKSGTAQSAESGPSYGPNTHSSTPIVVDECCADAQTSLFSEQEAKKKEEGKKQKRKRTKTEDPALSKQIGALIKAHHDHLPLHLQSVDILYQARPYREAAITLIRAGFTEEELVRYVDDTYREAWTQDRLLSLGYFARNYPAWRATHTELRPPTLNVETEPERKRIPLSFEEDPFLNGSMYKPVVQP